MPARMSLSENTAAKRRVGLACARAGNAHAAARAAPALSAERRSILKSMFNLLSMKYTRKIVADFQSAQLAIREEPMRTQSKLVVMFVAVIAAFASTAVRSQEG